MNLILDLENLKNVNKKDKEESIKNLKNLSEECEDLKNLLNIANEKLNITKIENKNIEHLYELNKFEESKYSKIISDIQDNSDFFENQLKISQETIYEYNEQISRLTDQIENFKIFEKNRIDNENEIESRNKDENKNMNKNENSNENSNDYSNENSNDNNDLIQSLDIPSIDMKLILKSKPQLQSQLVAQFNRILDQKMNGAQNEILDLQDRLRWYVRSLAWVFLIDFSY